MALGLSILAILLLLLVVAFGLSFGHLAQSNQWRTHTYQVMVETHAMSEGLLDIDASTRGYAITGDRTFLQPVVTGRKNFQLHWAEMHRLTRDSPSQQQRLQQILEQYGAWGQLYVEPLLKMQSGTSRSGLLSGRSVEIIRRGKPFTDKMRSLLNEVNQTETVLLKQRSAGVVRAKSLTEMVLIVGGATSLLLAASLFNILIKSRRLLEVKNRELGAEVRERQMAVGAYKELVEVLKQAREDADRANLAKSEFLSRMSHELRTPLNAILGFGQLLEREELTAQQHQRVEHILKGGRHLLGLINEVLDIARIEAGQMPLSPEPVHIRETLLDAMTMLHPVASQRDIVIELVDSALDKTHQYVRADRQRLRQVLLNLLGNAIKYNCEGGKVSIWCEPQIGERLRLLVRDTGPGIPPEKIGRLFSMFDRLDAEQTTTEGTGLGLALAQRLTEAMGGSMGVQSVVGEGSTFWIDLPLDEAPRAAMAVVPEKTRKNLSRSAAIAEDDPQRTVLYIEDNFSNLKLVEQILEQRPNILLLTAIQGRLGLELARQHVPNLILLDIHLPDTTGHDLLLRLKAEPALRDVPVVILSADATPGQIARMLGDGAHDYLTKPIDVGKFLHILDETL